MTGAVFAKLLAIFLTVALGWFVGRMRWLDPPGSEGADPARLLGNLAFHLFVPALLFRTTARLDFAAMPWHTVAAYFVPAVAFLLVVYAGERAAARQGGAAAAPSVRAIAATFGNSVQVGIPVATALFGERGLAIHIPLVSLHAIVLLSVLTALAEADIARERATTGQAGRLWPTLHKTLRNTIVHPVVLPVLAGLAWNATGVALPSVLDESLAALGSAVVPVCLVLIGLTLAYQDLQGRWRGALAISVLKLVALPALVLATARWGFGLSGVPLSVVVLMAALPVGSNALIFSQRYQTLEAETSAAIMLSTVSFAATASLWLAMLALLG